MRGLIEAYEELKEKRGVKPGAPLHILVKMADLDRALEQLSWKHWEVVLLHGLLGIPQRRVGQMLHISQQAVAKRYRQALEEIVFTINGGFD